MGVLDKIRSGEIKIVPGIKKLSRGRVELVNGQTLEIDPVFLATGYRSNVPSWLKKKYSSRGITNLELAPGGWVATKQ
ncbi:hypothetical protein V6N13_025048 [Hibiscus sabdariffa]